MSINWDETVVVSIPGDRTDGDWAKELTDVDPKASDGHGYHGDWLSVGASADLLPGSLYLRLSFSSSRRGKHLDQARVVCVLPPAVDGAYLVARSVADKGWAQELRKEARQWLALERSARIRLAMTRRISARTADAEAKRLEAVSTEEPDEITRLRARIEEAVAHCALMADRVAVWDLGDLRAEARLGNEEAVRAVGAQALTRAQEKHAASRAQALAQAERLEERIQQLQIALKELEQPAPGTRERPELVRAREALAALTPEERHSLLEAAVPAQID